MTPSLSSNNNIKYPPTSPSLTMLYNLQDHESNTESDDLYRAAHGYRRQKKPANQDGVIIDDIYNETDIENASSIHSKQVDEHVRKAWGIPVVNSASFVDIPLIDMPVLGAGYVGTSETINVIDT